MTWRVREPLKVFTRGASLRRRVAYSLAIVRLILVPVILLSIYYLLAMGRIVDRIVSVDAPAANLAERASIEMLDARRAERNYFLLHDPEDLQATRDSLSRLEQIIATCRELLPEEQATTQKILEEVKRYREQLDQAAARGGEPARVPVERIQEALRAYEKNLDEFLKRAPRMSRAQLIEELHNRLGSFDAQSATTLGTVDPVLRQATRQLRAASNEILRLASELENRSWERVQQDHQKARDLVRRAEWVLGIVSALTVILSVWVSFVLPRQAVKPLADLKSAVDHAAAGNYEMEFDVGGEGEVVALANSVRNLIAHVREVKTNSGPDARS